MKRVAVLGSLIVLGCGSGAAADEGATNVDSSPMDGPERLQATLPVIDFDSSADLPRAVPDLQTTVCADSTCSEELPPCGSGAIGQCYVLSVGDAPHELVFDLPGGFDGALRFAAPGFVDLDLIGGPVNDLPVPILKRTAMDVLVGQLGQPTPADPARGTLMVRVLDREARPVVGAEIEPVAGNFAMAVGFTLASDNIASHDPRTSERGVAGFVNAYPDAWTIAADGPNGEEMARATALVRAGVMTLVELRAGQ